LRLIDRIKKQACEQAYRIQQFLEGGNQVSYINEANWDRIARVLLGVAMLALGWAGVVGGGWGLFLKVIGFVPLLTGIVGWCPLYALFKVHTNKVTQ
jgi:fatty acid desaturase